ncbi:hypothetical protein D9M71_550880 [compost metagenome]
MRGIELQPATGKRLDLHGQRKVEAEHHFQVQRIAWLLAEQAGKVTEQLTAQRRFAALELLLLCLRPQAHQVEQVAIKTRGAVALVLDVELVLLPGLVEQRGHAMGKDVEKRMGGVVAVLNVPLQQ